MLMCLHRATKKTSFGVADLRHSPAMTCDRRLESGPFSSQSTAPGTQQRLLEPSIVLMCLHRATKKTSFGVADLRHSPAMTCDRRLESGSLGSQPVAPGIKQRLPGNN